MKIMNKLERINELVETLNRLAKAYYVDDNSFTVPELKILIDAVQAASFIPEDMSNELIEKLSVLGGTHREEVLKGKESENK